jgi:hypothetical protein
MEKKLDTTSGAKAYQRQDAEDRALEFRSFHRTLNRRLCASDVDLVEWRLIDGVWTPVAILEITRADSGTSVTQGYKDAILDRFFSRDSFQTMAATNIAKLLGVKAWIVLFKEGCQEFWIYNLSGGSGGRWYKYDRTRLENWLDHLEKGL